jgi:hypothetical protein
MLRADYSAADATLIFAAMISPDCQLFLMIFASDCRHFQRRRHAMPLRLFRQPLSFFI